MQDKGLYLVTVWFKAKAEHQAAFATAMAANAKLSVQNEPGCHLFEVRVHGAEVFLYEVYEDAAAFDAHLASPHYRAFAAETKDWIADKKVVALGWPPCGPSEVAA